MMHPSVLLPVPAVALVGTALSLSLALSAVVAGAVAGALALSRSRSRGRPAVRRQALKAHRVASAGAGDGPAYESVGQLVADMRNLRYREDPAFRAEVERKVARMGLKRAR